MLEKHLHKAAFVRIDEVLRNPSLFSGWLFAKELPLRHDTQALFIETDKDADPRDPFPPLLVGEMNLCELIEASTIGDICANVRDQPGPSNADDLLGALNFYLEHDAFIVLR